MELPIHTTGVQVSKYQHLKSLLTTTIGSIGCDFRPSIRPLVNKNRKRKYHLIHIVLFVKKKKKKKHFQLMKLWGGVER